MRALIGSNGTIGQSLLDMRHFDAVFNSDNLAQISQHAWHLVVCAAPTGNRLAINRGHTPDINDCQTIVDALAQTKIDHLVLISSVDAITAPDSVYGSNRAWLEKQLTNIHTTYTLRLSTLIGHRIKKNVLFDLKHGLFLDSLDRNAELQWCVLEDLWRQIDMSLNTGPGARNIVSEPISNQQIIDRFFPHITSGHNHSTARYNQQPYVYTRQDIFSAMEQYLA